VEQAILRLPAGLAADDAERHLYLARRAMERAAEAADLTDFAIPSASTRTVVYKGLFTAASAAGFYWDLQDPTFETSFAIFHQRYSTNTFPAWPIAQPFRVLAHNAEINTVRSNRAWMRTREVNPTSPTFGDRSGDLVPFLQAAQSDSGSLDNAYELLMLAGRSLEHTKEMLLPAAWENVADLHPATRAFYEYHAFLTEPWDGPAAICATDGVNLLAGLDRNGLRPARWTITDDVVLVASEAGVSPSVEAEAIATGQLGPGEAMRFDGRTGNVEFSDDIVARLASAAPYGEWIRKETLYVQTPFVDEDDDRFDVERLARVFGYTAEERRMILQEMAEGRTPVGSMGTDTPRAAMSSMPRRLPHYFHQLFAQVTNPPMDPIREKLVMSLRTYLGANGSLLEETEQQADKILIASPILSWKELVAIESTDDPRFRSRRIDATFEAAGGADALRARIAELRDEAEAAVRDGASILVISDEAVDAERAPVPILLALASVNTYLVSRGLRNDASVVVVSGEPRDSHDLATLVGFGASAVNPYVAIEEVRRLAVAGQVSVDPVVAQENYRSALQAGLLKIMSKMGICTVKAYRGSSLFEVIGLDDEMMSFGFSFAERRIGGVGLDHVARHTLALHATYVEGEEQPGGFYKHKRGGEAHVTSPKVVLKLQKAVRSGDYEDWEAYLTEIDDRDPAQLRDLLRFADRTPIDLDSVEPASAIARRFTSAAMSMGALSKEAHEALAEAMNHLGGLSNSGEGGEDEARFGTSRNSAIKQVASGRFGVTPGYLASAEELQIKMAQGSKPGEGGQLPGHKVSPEIARLRHTIPGTTLISPPPHHDIYSIEDLAQLIYDLKAFKPTARGNVKLGSEPGVGTVAVGVAKAAADVITISGMDGGTGASPLVSIKHAGSPWELGLAEAHQILLLNGLRSRVSVEADGGMRTGRDVVIAALLGAERFGFGTLPLLALGCKMVRQCHENTCPVGIATQREDLRAKFTGAAEQVVTLFTLLSEEVRRHLASLGARSLDEVIGRADFLEPVDPTHPIASQLAPLLVRAEGRRRHPGYLKTERSLLGDRLVDDAAPAIEHGTPVAVAYPITNEDRTVGARLSGAIAAVRGDAGLPAGSVTVDLAGVAGQSFGAWLSNGIDLRLDGTANDYVGKGMGGGRITVRPSVRGGGPAHGAGNAVLYGATGGQLHVAGTVGQRFAVRNSGAVAVVEGCSDHGCEYMTGGVAVVLGPVGRNFAAGMTGGAAYVFDPDGLLNARLADSAPSMRRLGEAEEIEVRALTEEHARITDSKIAGTILDDWDRALRRFWVLRPGEPLDRPGEVLVAAPMARA
jgi:glutamate synthase domain-containing protein 2/glutamate synthase domain-containing protein 3